jgi:hypothetical protein
VDFLGSTSCSHLEKYFCQWMSIPGGQQDRRKKNTMLELILAENFTVLGGRMDIRILMPRYVNSGIYYGVMDWT